MIIATTEFSEVTATPTGLTWTSPPVPAGKRILLRSFGASVNNGTVILKLGAQAIRVVVDGTVEFNQARGFIGTGGSFTIQRINNSGTPRVVAAWIDALVED